MSICYVFVIYFNTGMWVVNCNCLSIERMNLGRSRLRNEDTKSHAVRESLPLDLLKISIPKDKLLVSSINELSCRLQTMAVVPKGKFYYIH